MSRSKGLAPAVESSSVGFSHPSFFSSVSPTFALDFIPGRFAVVIYDGPHLVEVDSEFLPWNDARGRAHHLSTVHMGSDRWVAAVPQPISRATFTASSASRSA